MDVKALSQYKNLFIGLAIIITFAMLVQGILSHYSLQRDEIDAKILELEEGERTIMRWKKLNWDVEELNKSFLTKDTLSFKKFLEEKANSLGIRITSLRTSHVEKDFYWEATIHLGMEGSYKDFIEFIKAIEEKSVVAEKIKIASGKNVRDEKIDVTLKGFIIKQ